MPDEQPKCERCGAAENAHPMPSAWPLFGGCETFVPPTAEGALADRLLAARQRALGKPTVVITWDDSALLLDMLLERDGAERRLAEIARLLGNVDRREGHEVSDEMWGEIETLARGGDR